MESSLVSCTAVAHVRHQRNRGHVFLVTVRGWTKRSRSIARFGREATGLKLTGMGAAVRFLHAISRYSTRTAGLVTRVPITAVPRYVGIHLRVSLAFHDSSEQERGEQTAGSVVGDIYIVTIYAGLW
jgi:hypothetical protein